MTYADESSIAWLHWSISRAPAALVRWSVLVAVSETETITPESTVESTREQCDRDRVIHTHAELETFLQGGKHFNWK